MVERKGELMLLFSYGSRLANTCLTTVWNVCTCTWEEPWPCRALSHTHTSLHLLLMPKGPSELTDMQVGFSLQVSTTKKQSPW